ncbi:hypothetical protein H8356DRAFT_1420681 [Neocallimastix lanati (nom. inval.)]|nr:hypothetical protein H8356DRAFT_1420681 [Neocallimastix sp. JGI-2020a]
MLMKIQHFGTRSFKVDVQLSESFSIKKRNSNYLKAQLQKYPEFSIGFRWELHARCGYKFKAGITKAAKMLEENCAKRFLYEKYFIISKYNPISNSNVNIVITYKNHIESSTDSDSDSSNEVYIINNDNNRNNFVNNNSISDMNSSIGENYVIDLNYKKKRDVLFKNQIITGDYSKTPFLMRSAALFTEIKLRVSSRQGLLFPKDKHKLTKSFNAENEIRQVSRANASEGEDHNFFQIVHLNPNQYGNEVHSGGPESDLEQYHTYDGCACCTNQNSKFSTPLVGKSILKYLVHHNADVALIKTCNIMQHNADVALIKTVNLVHLSREKYCEIYKTCNIMQHNADVALIKTVNLVHLYTPLVGKSIVKYIKQYCTNQNSKFSTPLVAKSIVKYLAQHGADVAPIKTVNLVYLSREKYCEIYKTVNLVHL